MKNLMLALAALTAFTSLYSQTSNRELPIAYNSTNTEMDTSALDNYTKALHSIPGKAVRNFKQCHKHIDYEFWFAIPNGYRARFVKNNIRHDVTYDKRGKWLYTIRQYKEDKFPRDIRAQVKEIYYDYSIMLVEEIKRPLKPLVYVVHMENQHTFKNVQVCDNEMETVLEIKKV